MAGIVSSASLSRKNCTIPVLWLTRFSCYWCDWSQHILWQNTWPSYYKTTQSSSEDKDSIYRKHIGKVSRLRFNYPSLTYLDHCADNFRQKLMCDADVGVITYDWLKGHQHPLPNFNTIHKCRNLKAIWGWHKDHRVQRNGTDDFAKMPNSVVLDHLPW